MVRQLFTYRRISVYVIRYFSVLLNGCVLRNDCWFSLNCFGFVSASRPFFWLWAGICFWLIPVYHRLTGISRMSKNEMAICGCDAGFFGAMVVLLWCRTVAFCGAGVMLLWCFTCTFVVLFRKSALIYLFNLLIFNKISHIKISTPPPPDPVSGRTVVK